MHTARHTLTNFQASHTVVLPDERTLKKKVLVFSTSGSETFPVQSQRCSYILICIFSNQSEVLQNNQSECREPANQGSGI